MATVPSIDTRESEALLEMTEFERLRDGPAWFQADGGSAKISWPTPSNDMRGVPGGDLM